MEETKKEIQLLTKENAELSESICSWSRNCGLLGDQITKLKLINKKLTADNEELQSNLEKNANQLERNAKDIKYVMQSLDKVKLHNKKLLEENKKVSTRPVDQKMAESERHTSTTSDIKVDELIKEIHVKDETINFYKEICDAKVSEVNELKQIIRTLQSNISKRSNIANGLIVKVLPRE